MPARRRLLTDMLRDQSGAVLIYVALTMPVLLGLTAIAVDFSLAYFTGNRLQVAADASALAGAARLPNDANVTSEATQFAQANIPDVGGTTVLADADVVTGHWDEDNRTFTAGGNPKNAVRVVTRRSAANSNSLPTIFGGFLGHSSFQLARTAVAEMRPDDCLILGLIAEGKIVLGSANTLSGVCAHGQSGAKIGSDNIFTNAELSMGDLSDLEAGGNNTGLEDALAERDLSPVDALRISEILQDIAAGQGPWPSYLDGSTISTSTLPTTPMAGKLYIVSNDVTLTGAVSGFGVYSSKKITISSDATLQNMFLAANDNVEAGSKIQFGAADFCATGDGAVFMAALKEVKLGSNNSFTGVQIVAGTSVDLGSDLQNVSGLAVQSGGDIKMGSTHASECGRTTHNLFGGGKKVLRLVY